LHPSDPTRDLPNLCFRKSLDDDQRFETAKAVTWEGIGQSVLVSSRDANELGVRSADISGRVEARRRELAAHRGL
jgi:hypothetical protein